MLVLYAEHTDFREHFHYCEQFTHPTSTEMLSEGFRPVHYLHHIIKIQEQLMSQLTEEQVKQLIMDIGIEIEVVDYIAESRVDETTKSREDYIKKIQSIKENFEKLKKHGAEIESCKKILEQLCNCLSQGKILIVMVCRCLHY